MIEDTFFVRTHDTLFKELVHIRDTYKIPIIWVSGRKVRPNEVCDAECVRFFVDRGETIFIAKGSYDLYTNGESVYQCPELGTRNLKFHLMRLFK